MTNATKSPVIVNMFGSLFEPFVFHLTTTKKKIRQPHETLIPLASSAICVEMTIETVKKCTERTNRYFVSYCFNVMYPCRLCVFFTGHSLLIAAHELRQCCRCVTSFFVYHQHCIASVSLPVHRLYLAPTSLLSVNIAMVSLLALRLLCDRWNPADVKLHKRKKPFIVPVNFFACIRQLCNGFVKSFFYLSSRNCNYNNEWFIYNIL